MFQSNKDNKLNEETERDLDQDLKVTKDLNKEMTDLSEVYYYWSRKKSFKKKVIEKRKLELDIWLAEKRAQITEKYFSEVPASKQPSIKVKEEKIMMDHKKEYVEKKIEIIYLERDYDDFSGALEALKLKGSMLIQLGAEDRMESKFGGMHINE